MRSRNPLIIKHVIKSLQESLFVFILFLDIFLEYTKTFWIALTFYVRGYILQSSYERNCATESPRNWGNYCINLDIRLITYSISSLLGHAFAVLITLFIIVWICSELLLELEDRSRPFRQWWQNWYPYRGLRIKACGG